MKVQLSVSKIDAQTHGLEMLPLRISLVSHRSPTHKVQMNWQIDKEEAGHAVQESRPRYDPSERTFQNRSVQSWKASQAVRSW